MLSSIVLSHFISGGIAILAGFTTLFFKKGGTVHSYLGLTFYFSMLILGVTGVYVALIREIPLSLMNGMLICYFVLSSYLAIKQRPNTVSQWDWVLLGFICLQLMGFIYFAIAASEAPGGELGGFGPVAFIAFGTVAAFCLLTDISYLMKGGYSGKQRIIRHLWRMFFPLFMSTTAFFLGQAKLLPEELRKIYFLLLPVVIVIVTMIYWLASVQFGKRFSTS